MNNYTTTSAQVVIEPESSIFDATLRLFSSDGTCFLISGYQTITALFEDLRKEGLQESTTPVLFYNNWEGADYDNENR